VSESLFNPRRDFVFQADHEVVYQRNMLLATDDVPMNILLTGKGNDSKPEGLVDQVHSGVGGLKLHEVGLEI
jgi:urease alpha subunit